MNNNAYFSPCAQLSQRYFPSLLDILVMHSYKTHYYGQEISSFNQVMPF